MRFIAVGLLATCLAFGLAACGGDDEGGTTAATTSAATTDQTEPTTAQSDSSGDESETEGPARSKEIDELLAMHPVFPTKRFMNFAAKGNPGACSLLSAKGRKAMETAHGESCEKTIRAAAAGHDEPGLLVNGEFVPVDEFSDLNFLATILVLEKETARISIDNNRPPFRLSKYGRIWLLDSVPLAEVGTVR